ncbi:MAG: HEAT repeat domain-containing protein [Pirellulales bacterium]
MIDRLLSGLAIIGLSIAGCNAQPSQPNPSHKMSTSDRPSRSRPGAEKSTASDAAPSGPLEASETFWPGMVLLNEAGYPEIHIPAKREPSQAVPTLVGFLEHNKDAGIRRSAAEWLGAVGARTGQTIPALRKALDDPSADVREAAASAIQRIESARPSGAR